MLKACASAAVGGVCDMIFILPLLARSIMDFVMPGIPMAALKSIITGAFCTGFGITAVDPGGVR